MLYNRGIPIEEQEDWLNAGWDDIYPWRMLDEDNMIRGCKALKDCIEFEQDVIFVEDSDVDGTTSAALTMNYLYKAFPDWYKNHVSYLIHAGKQHGLADMMPRIKEKMPALVICMDSASNDLEQHRELDSLGIKVFCGDHHECSKENYLKSPAIIVNVQCCDYPNKALTGAGVAFKFIQAFEDIYHTGIDPTEFIDLAMLGNVGDMSDFREKEIRALVNVGLQNIKNPFFYSLLKKNEYTYDKHHKGYLGLAFAAIPMINSVHRSGTMEEKEEVFKAFLLFDCFEKVESSKRGEKGVMIPRYQNAVTIVEQVKRRQTQLQDTAMENITQKIEEKHLTDNAIVAVVVEPGECEAELAGLCANKIQAQYQHPAMVLRRTKDKDDVEEKYVGSLRNYSNCSISDMASLCRNTGLPDFVAGHEAAAGFGIPASKFSDFIAATNELYKGIDFTPVYWVDYIWNQYTIDPQAILELGGLEIYGQEISESQVVVEDIPLNESNVTLMGAKRNTIKVMCGSVACILFGTDEDTYQEFVSGNKSLTICGTPNLNEWCGNVSPQILIDDYELTEAEEEWIF